MAIYFFQVHPHRASSQLVAIYAVGSERYLSSLAAIAALGFGRTYCDAIRLKVTSGSTDAHALHQYAAALDRTLKAKARRERLANVPF